MKFLLFLAAAVATLAVVTDASNRDNRVVTGEDVSAAILTNSNVNLGNLDSLNDDIGGFESTSSSSSDGPKLVGANVCTKQEP